MLRRGFNTVARSVRRTVEVPARFLNVQEADGKSLMTKFGVDCQHGYVVKSASEVPAVCQRLVDEYKTTNFIVKSQILAGGRGKGTFDNGFKGGVKFAKDVAAATDYTGKMLGNKLITVQTPPGGIEVQKVYIAECLDIKRELYLALLLDRASRGPVLIASTQGGVEIEEVAKTNPEAIQRLPLSYTKDGIKADDAALRAFGEGLGFTGATLDTAITMFTRLMEMAAKLDITQLEVNPLVETDDGRVVAIDAKINFDDSAEFRQKEVFALRDTAEEDPRETAAAKWDLNYIGLDGEIGCLVNGAGLAMATMDIIKLKGMNPANFLDVGGTATADRVAAAFDIITSDPKVKGILVNIFGGIVDCGMIADGVIHAAKKTQLKVPVVVRLSGTNAEAGQKKLEASGLQLHSAKDMDSAAELIVKLTGGVAPAV